MSEFPHFRIYKRSKHPALILNHATKDREDDSFLYRKTSHSKGLTKGGFTTVSPNPNPKDKNPMYIENKKRVDYKIKFSKKLPWKFPKK